jgi:cytochrome oxidase assembly protein ShyY1
MIGHLVALLVAVLFVNLGLWQLDRLQTRKETNAAIRTAQSSPPFALSSANDITSLQEYRAVTVTGRPDISNEVYVRYPLLEGRSGYFVLTPLVLADGSVLLINRGWIPVEEGRDDSRNQRPTAEAVAVTGLVQKSRTVRNSRVGGTEGNPPVPTITAVNTAAAASLMAYKNLPSRFVQQTEIAGSGVVRPLPAPEVTEGSHLSYALQWFSFAAIGLVGWSILILRHRRSADGHRGGEDQSRD